MNERQSKLSLKSTDPARKRRSWHFERCSGTREVAGIRHFYKQRQIGKQTHRWLRAPSQQKQIDLIMQHMEECLASLTAPSSRNPPSD